jgi:hypothetical protein
MLFYIDICDCSVSFENNKDENEMNQKLECISKLKTIVHKMVCAKKKLEMLKIEKGKEMNRKLECMIKLKPIIHGKMLMVCAKKELEMLKIEKGKEMNRKLECILKLKPVIHGKLMRDKTILHNHISKFFTENADIVNYAKQRVKIITCQKDSRSNKSKEDRKREKLIKNIKCLMRSIRTYADVVKGCKFDKMDKWMKNAVCSFS